MTAHHPALLVIDGLLYAMIAGALFLVLSNAWRLRGRRETLGLRWLELITQTAPFVGLAGTVLAVIQALSQAGRADFATLSPLLGQALWTTFLGIVAAIPAAAGTVYFRKD